MQLQTHGAKKYSRSTLLASSAERRWSTIAVDVREHGVSETPFMASPCVEICLVVAGNNDAIVSRIGEGFCQEAVAKTGAIWLSPAGIGKTLAISASIPETVHMYLPAELFERLKDDPDFPSVSANSICHVAGIDDEVIEHIGRSVLSELTNETAAGRIYVETASLMLAARLVQKHYDGEVRTLRAPSLHGLDQGRLRRVLDYIEANIEEEITLKDLAGIAGYSPFHFARMFTLATGLSPHRYISRIRLENAKSELASAELALAEVAFNARFSSQASFTRAFHRATGMTPKEYQRRRA